MLIMGTNMQGVNETKKYLTSQFKMKDMGEVDTILGIKIKKHSGVMLYVNLITLTRFYPNLIIWE